jgi:hypothetical protein
MQYRKISLELIVPADEAGPVMTELDAALDQIEAKTRTFWGWDRDGHCRGFGDTNEIRAFALIGCR